MSAHSAVKLKELVLDVASWNPLRSDSDAEFQYIDLSAVNQETKAITGERTVLCAEAPSRARQIVRQRDVLVSTVRPNLNAVALVPENLDGATASTGFCVLRANPELLASNYLFHWVKTDAFINSMVQQATGASYPAVSDKIVLESKIPLPSLGDQSRIASILDQADIIRSKRREALRQLDCLKQSIFLEIFGDQRSSNFRATGIPLSTLVEINPKISAQERANLKGKEVTFVPMASIDEFEKRIQFFEKREYGEVSKGYTPFKIGDVLVAKITPCYENGKMAIAEDIPTTFGFGSTEFHVFRCNSPHLSLFVFHLLQLGWIAEAGEKSMKGAAGQKRVPADFFGNLLITPPDTGKLNTFAERIYKINELKVKGRDSLNELNALFASLQQRAFRGEL